MELKEAYKIVIKNLSKFSNDELDQLELRSGQEMWERYNLENPADFED